MKFSKRIDFFKFYKIVKFNLFDTEISDFDEIINFVANMLKICSCRITATIINTSSIISNKYDDLEDKYEILTIFINLSNNIVIFNFENENRIEKILEKEGVCIDLSSNLSFLIDKKNVEILKISIYNK